MTGITQPFVGSVTKLNLVATLGAAITTNADEVAEVAEIGTVPLSANIIKFNSFGQTFKESRVGQKDPGEIDLTLNWIPSDTKHLALKTAFDNGTIVFPSIVWYDGAENARADMSAYVASYEVETPIDGIVTAKVKLSLTGVVTITEVTNVALNY